MSRPITIKDIAKKFKCSPSTVSRALNNHSSINEDTRRNLQEYAQKVGYQRNQVSLSLLNKKTATVGVIVPTINNYYESAIIEGLDAALQPSGYTLNICVTNEQYLLELEYVEKLLSNRVEGIFLSVSQETYDSGHYEHLESIVKRGLPLIFIDREYEGFATGSVTIDDYHGAFAAVEHLIQSGRKRIAHLKGPNGMALAEQRFKGYIECLKKYNIPEDQSLIINTNFKVESAIKPTEQLLALAEPPDAIFGVNDQVAIGAMKVVRDRGLQVPDTIWAYRAVAVHGQLGNVFIFQENFSFVGLYQANHHIKGSGFTSSVGPQKTNNFTLFYLYRNMVYNGAAAVLWLALVGFGMKKLRTYYYPIGRKYHVEYIRLQSI